MERPKESSEVPSTEAIMRAEEVVIGSVAKAWFNPKVCPQLKSALLDSLYQMEMVTLYAQLLTIKR